MNSRRRAVGELTAGAGGVDGVLHQARALIEAVEADRLYGARPERFLSTQDEGALRRALAHLVVGDVRSIGVVLPDQGAEDEVLRVTSACCTAASGDAAMRLLCAPGVSHLEPVRTALRELTPCEMRTSEGALRETVLLPGRFAMIWPDLGAESRQVLVIRDAAVVGTLSSLFAVAWANGSRPADRPSRFGRARSEVGRRILGSLMAGQIDEVAARDLGMPLRSYRRHIAEIMREMGASSRFQAGARAVELGLLPAEALRSAAVPDTPDASAQAATG
ncbi:helix-turn-helix transcriptional regulator [Streptomyces cucumeris]|uniref:helix-turn-helix transcriptional regulator n=1 Tax=Streptomyces cucumeris TaxID=2962890 RepID=UPI003D742A82